MQLDDARWEGLCGGYRIPYDPRPALEALRNGTGLDAAWKELWNDLHHQGDVGEASYASIPALVDIHRDFRDLGPNLYAFAACIEVERHRKKNPPVPEWLAEEYRAAWESLVEFALDDLDLEPVATARVRGVGRGTAQADDALLIRSALAVCALGRGELKLGALISWMDQSEIDDLAEQWLGWSDQYDAGRAP